MRVKPTHTVQLEGMPVQKILRWYVGVVHDYNHDDDLVLIDEKKGAIPDGATSATLTGALKDGAPIQGSDEICLLPRWEEEEAWCAGARGRTPTEPTFPSQVLELVVRVPWPRTPGPPAR